MKRDILGVVLAFIGYHDTPKASLQKPLLHCMQKRSPSAGDIFQGALSDQIAHESPRVSRKPLERRPETPSSTPKITHVRVACGEKIVCASFFDLSGYAQPTAHQVLGVVPTASSREIRSAYKRRRRYIKKCYQGHFDMKFAQKAALLYLKQQYAIAQHPVELP